MYHERQLRKSYHFFAKNPIIAEWEELWRIDMDLVAPRKTLGVAWGNELLACPAQVDATRIRQAAIIDEITNVPFVVTLLESITQCKSSPDAF